MVADFILLLETNLKLMNYFWNFPFNIFRLQSDHWLTETVESEPADKGRATVEKIFLND